MRQILSKHNMRHNLSSRLKETARSMAQMMGVVRHHPSKRILGSSFTRIPNVSRVNVRIGKMNSYLETLGYKKRVNTRIEAWRLDPEEVMNKYTAKQVRRLRKLKKINPEKFWRVSWFLMINSVTIRTMTWIKVVPQWWYTMPMWHIKRTNNKVNEILRTRDDFLVTKRVYIPKSDGSQRPIGVPNLEWRIFLSMFNKFLTTFLEGEIKSSQHAYMPGKGSLTAWRDVLKNVIKAKYIYETDLKGFFNNVSLAAIQSRLLDLGMPWETAKYIINLNMSHPSKPCGQDFEKDDPSRLYLEKRYDSKWMLEGGYNPSELMKLWRWYKKEGTGSYWKKVLVSGSLSPGVAQGSPLSPLLAILAMDRYLSQAKNVNYADDQLFYSNQYFVTGSVPEDGAIEKPSKCSWIKKDGKWLKEFKFLGMIYNPFTKELRSETRNGINITIPTDITDWYKEIKRISNDKLLEKFAYLELFGWIQACLYQGSFPNKHQELIQKCNIGKIHRLSWLGNYFESKTLGSRASVSLAQLLKTGEYKFAVESDRWYKDKRVGPYLRLKGPWTKETKAKPITPSNITPTRRFLLMDPTFKG